MVTAVVLTKNEEKNIARCLASLEWCDEIIVIDDYSTDNTVAIAEKAKATVYQRSLNGDFARQRNFGLAKASSDWVLFVDADEVVSKDLADEMYQQTSQFLTSADGFFVKREDVLWGKKLCYGEVGDIKLLRLAKKDKGEWVGKVHETWQVAGTLATLKHPLQHYPHQSVAEFLSEVNSYSTLRAQELFDLKRRTNFLEIVLYPKGKFLLNYILKQGFRDGIPGLIVALMMSFHSFLVRGKLWQLWRKK
jgi:glycosyltransferase involved in cell wall biosynthesis